MMTWSRRRRSTSPPDSSGASSLHLDEEPVGALRVLDVRRRTRPEARRAPPAPARSTARPSTHACSKAPCAARSWSRWGWTRSTARIGWDSGSGAGLVMVPPGYVEPVGTSARTANSDVVPTEDSSKTSALDPAAASGETVSRDEREPCGDLAGGRAPRRRACRTLESGPRATPTRPDRAVTQRARPPSPTVAWRDDRASVRCGWNGRSSGSTPSGAVARSHRAGERRKRVATVVDAEPQHRRARRATGTRPRHRGRAATARDRAGSRPARRRARRRRRPRRGTAA